VSTGIIGIYAYGCTVRGILAASTNLVFSSDYMTIVGCLVDFSTTATGAIVVFDCNNGLSMIVGNAIRMPNTSVPTVLVFDASNAGASLMESGNSVFHLVNGYSSTHKIYSLSANALLYSQLGARSTLAISLTAAQSNTDPIVIPGAEASNIIAQNTSTAAHSGNVQITVEPAPIGSTLDLEIWNDTAGLITYEWGTNVSGSGSTFTVAANSVRTFRLVMCATPSSRWRLVGTVAGAEVAEV